MTISNVQVQGILGVAESYPVGTVTIAEVQFNLDGAGTHDLGPIINAVTAPGGGTSQGLLIWYVDGGAATLATGGGAALLPCLDPSNNNLQFRQMSSGVGGVANAAVNGVRATVWIAN